MSKKVSVIVPVYNIENYIEGCIKSLISQTYNDIEIILVDDGSTDNSLNVCEQFAGIDNRIKIVNKANGGLSSARNAGIDVATGDYIIFVDGDDYIAANTLLELVSQIEKYDADIVQFGYVETNVDYSNQVCEPVSTTELVNDTHEMFKRLYSIGGEAASACTKLYKVYLFDSLRFKEGINNEDEQMITFMLQKAQSVLYTDFKPYYYVTRQGSIINSRFSKKKLDIIDILEERKLQLAKLGFNDFLQTENNRIFLTLINLWCESKTAKDAENNKIISDKIKEFVKNENVTLSLKFNIIYKLCKLNNRFVYLYYIYKKLSKQV